MAAQMNWRQGAGQIKVYIKPQTNPTAQVDGRVGPLGLTGQKIINLKQNRPAHFDGPAGPLGLTGRININLKQNRPAHVDAPVGLLGLAGQINKLTTHHTTNCCFVFITEISTTHENEGSYIFQQTKNN
jgi:hypothetical protein